jgi:hypothetical protein
MVLASPAGIRPTRSRPLLSRSTLAAFRGRAERQAAIRAAAAIGPNVTRLADAEGQAAQGYHASVAAQLEADRIAIPKLSERAVAGLRLVGRN